MDKNINQKLIHLFPLTIYKSHLGLTDSERKELIEDVYLQEKQSKNVKYKNNYNSWTGDTQGFEFLFLNKKFNRLFSLISKEIKAYTEVIGIHSEKIDFYYQRAWATISRKGENISMHSHNQSHITFAYYLKKKKDDGKLVFHNEKAQNEISSGMFNSNLYKENLFKPNYANAARCNFPPELDEIVIFPSKTQHSTITNETSDDRMSISGDISIISKNSENLETLLTPINKWKKF